MAEFEAAGAAVAPVYNAADLVADPQVQALQMLTEVPDPDLGSVLMHNVLFRMSATPGAIRFPGRPIGADTRTVLCEELGVDEQRLAELEERGVVR